MCTNVFIRLIFMQTICLPFRCVCVFALSPFSFSHFLLAASLAAYFLLAKNTHKMLFCDALWCWLTEYPNQYTTNSLIDWVNGWVNDWESEWMTEGLTDWLTDYLPEWLTNLMYWRMTYCLTEELTCRIPLWMIPLVEYWLSPWLTEGLTDWLPFCTTDSGTEWLPV